MIEQAMGWRTHPASPYCIVTDEEHELLSGRVNLDSYTEFSILRSSAQTAFSPQLDQFSDTVSTLFVQV